MRPHRVITAGLAALAVMLAPATAAQAARPTSTSAPASALSLSAGPDDAAKIWSVRPAGADGKPDARTHFTLQGAPGTTLTDKALISNLSTVPITLAVYGTDARNTPDGRFDLYPADQKPTDVGSWMTFNQATVSIPASGSLVVPFSVVIPSSAVPGDHAGGLIVSLISLGAGSGQKVNVDTRIGVRMYLRIPGNLRPSLGVGPVTAAYAGVGNPFGSGKVNYTYTVTNPGNIRLSAKQKISVTGLFGIDLASITPKDMPELLPGQSYTFSGSIDGVFPAGPLTMTVQLSPYPDPLQPVGQTLGAVTGSASTWAMPWLLIGLIVLLIIGLIVLWLLRRRRVLARLDEAMLTAREETLQEVRAGSRSDA
jgi:hypothetical protein